MNENSLKSRQERTIAAISTGLAPGGIGIVRVSGSQAREIADRVFRGISGKKIADMKGYTAQLGGVFSGDEKLDDAVALVFAAPKSYTGEDVVELSCHGGLYVTKRVLREVLQAGASPAEPGEFTRRAFLNGKMDLAQAEAVMGLIGAQGEQSARSAEAGNEGLLSKKINTVRDELTALTAHLAAWADFPEEDVPLLEETELSRSLEKIGEELNALLATFDTGKIFREGVDTVIAGRPNTGKSTLMNLLTGQERSIVTQYAGTTRDIVEDTVQLGGIPLRLADTAGLRDTDDPVEKIGVSAAEKRLRTAQLVLAVFDASETLDEEDLSWISTLDPARTVAVVNKTDLPKQLDTALLEGKFPHIVSLSALTGEGLDSLEKTVTDLLGAKEFDPGDGVLFTERQRDCVAQALSNLKEAKKTLEEGLTLDAVTVCVEDTLSALYSLTGEKVPDEVIDRVFETFCVGK